MLNLKELYPALKDGDERSFCFLNIDVVGHSKLDAVFSPESIQKTFINFREWLNTIIGNRYGKEMDWAEDGGIFCFLQENMSDRAVDIAVLSAMEILNCLHEFNQHGKNLLKKEGKQTDVRVRIGIDFDTAIFQADPGNWHSSALNTSAKIQKSTLPDSALITNTIYKHLTDKVLIPLKKDLHFRQSSITFNNEPLFVFSLERFIDPVYQDYFILISLTRQKEFEHLGNWVDLYAMEPEFLSRQEQDKGKTFKAIDLITDCAASGKNALIYRDSGTGKTFTCLKLFEDMKEKYCSPEADLHEKIPLFVELLRIKHQDFDTIVRGSIDQDTFKRDKKNFVIFLDGLNEVGNLNEQRNTIEIIDRFARENPETRLFVTMQTLDESYLHLPHFTIYEIQPFKRNDVIQYMTKFTKKFPTKGEAEKIYDDLSDLVRNLISVPVFLSIFILNYQKDKPVIINNPGAMLEEYEKFLCGEREPYRVPMEHKYRKDFIPFLAFTMCKNNEIEVNQNRFKEHVKEFSSSFDEYETIDVISNRYKIIKKDNRNYVKFIHQTLRDFFAGVHLKNENKTPDELISLIYKDKTPNNDLLSAVKFLVGIIKPEVSKEIILKFIESNLYYSCELFAWSSITAYEDKFVTSLDEKIDIDSHDYLLHLNEAVSFYLKILDLLKNIGRFNEPLYAYYLQSAGLVYRRKLEYDNAIACLKKAIWIYEQNSMQTDPDYAKCLVNLGIVFDDRLDYYPAIECFEKAIRIYEQNSMQTHFEYARCHMNLGIVYLRQLDYDRAIAHFKKAIQIYEQNSMQTHPSYGHCHINLGIAYRNKLNYNQAIACFKKAIQIYEQNSMQNHISYGTCHMNLGNTYISTSDFDHAIVCYQKAVQTYEQNSMQTYPEYAKCHMNLGIAYYRIGKKDKAVILLDFALTVYEKSIGKNHPSYQQCLKNLNKMKSYK